ncbi:MAG: carboxymuconolactone decarboxylase family protein [Wenzhouxiangellaceae bacterium]|nr:carboxymuconolactone decarboxylase family protein [Wenzhouxiangellaceae bacterium]
MNINELKQQLPDYARDLKINFGNVLDAEQHEHLSAEQIWGVALATAIASRNKTLIQAVEAQAREVLDEAYFKAAKAAAAIMGMNNIYYRFLHLAGNEEYAKLPARLRMTIIGNPGIEKADFELISLAVSAINGCGMCIDSHEKILIKAGVSINAIQDAVRIASVMHAVAVVLDTDTDIDLAAAA